MLLEEEKLTNVKIDGCTTDNEWSSRDLAVSILWGITRLSREYLVTNVKIRSKLSDKCSSNYVCICQ